MIPKDLFQKIRRIEITTSRLVTDIFAGQYHSVFKGQGIEFDEVREYQIGDDIRTIDWNVTARTGRPHIKKYVEERELTVMILVDVSGSCRFGTSHMLKSQLAAEVSALLALSAIRNHDKVGLIIFTDTIEKFIPPRKGLKHVLRVIREILYFKPKGRSTDLVKAIDYLNRVMTRRTISFVISDFFDNHSPEKIKSTLAVANKRHDLIAVTLNDRKEIELNDCSLVSIQDPETGQMLVVDTSDANLRDKFHQENQERLRKRERFLRGLSVDQIDLFTDTPYADELIKFFLKRRKKRS